MVEPLSYIIDAETNSVWNSCAVTFPATVKSPDISALPFISKLVPSNSVPCILPVTVRSPDTKVSWVKLNPLVEVVLIL